MKTEPLRFKKAIQALIGAFFDETLAKGNCRACAVGNMIAYSAGEKVKIVDGEAFCNYDNISWGDVFCTNGSFQEVHPEKLNESIRKSIEITGYNTEQLMAVERAFETSTEIYLYQYPIRERSEIMQDQFNGLCAVFDVLCEIEGLNSEVYKPYLNYNEDFSPVTALEQSK